MTLRGLDGFFYLILPAGREKNHALEKILSQSFPDVNMVAC
jgi:hypothetical protein